MVDCYLSNTNVIALWLSYYPKLDIILLLFKDNENEGYICEVVELNIPKVINDKSKKDSIFLLTMKSNFNLMPTINSNIHSSTPYIFNNNIKNYKNINNIEVENLQKLHKELKSLN
jgi:hypothetical protein